MRTLRTLIITVLAAGSLMACTIEQRTDRTPTRTEDTRRQIIQPEGVARLPVFSSAVRRQCDCS